MKHITSRGNIYSTHDSAEIVSCNGPMCSTKHVVKLQPIHSIIVREKVQNTAKNGILKKRKNITNVESDNIHAYSPEDHGDHPQSVLLSFAK